MIQNMHSTNYLNTTGNHLSIRTIVIHFPIGCNIIYLGTEKLSSNEVMPLKLIILLNCIIRQNSHKNILKTSKTNLIDVR